MSDTPARIHRVSRAGPGVSVPIDPATRVSGAEAVTDWPAFADASGRLRIGHQAGGPGIRTVHYRETEFCLLLEGRVRLDGPDGTVEFGPGEAFVIEAGFLGTWEILEPAVKLYVVLEPEPTVIP